MEQNRRRLELVANPLLLIWILFGSSLLLLASRAGGALQGVEADRISLRRIGRFLLQDWNAQVKARSDNNYVNSLPVASFVVGSVAVSVVFIFLFCTFIGFLQNRFEVKVVDSEKRHCEGSGISAPSFMLASGILEQFSYKELQTGTLNFTEKLGRGGGRVYKGFLSNLTEVAVKRLSREEFEHDHVRQFDMFPRSEFEQDVKKVAAVYHQGLVHLYGYCSEGDHRLLVCEYLPTGSLGNYIYSQPSKNILDWSTRFRIVLGTARVTAFIHERGSGDEALKLHGRIHPENILLTEDYEPKLADYGFSRPNAARDQTLLRTTSVTAAAGKYEYFAPEWWAADPEMPAPLTPKSDVYSFGILVLEIIAGKPIGDFYRSNPSWEFQALNPNSRRGAEEDETELSSSYAELVDPELKGIVDIGQLRAALHAAYWCIQSVVDARPTMAALVDILEGKVDLLHESPPTPSSTVVFSPMRNQNSGHNSSNLQGFRFSDSRRLSRLEMLSEGVNSFGSHSSSGHLTTN